VTSEAATSVGSISVDRTDVGGCRSGEAAASTLAAIVMISAGVR
jgi:hypothetical protein